MKRRTTSRRLLAALTAAAVLIVTACGSTDDETDGSSVGPVTVQTAVGPVTVDAKPERVVAIGSQWTDTVLALGVTPVVFYVGANAAIKVRALA